MSIYDNGETPMPESGEELWRQAEDALDFDLIMRRKLEADPTQSVELEEFLEELGITQQDIDNAPDGQG